MYVPDMAVAQHMARMSNWSLRTWQATEAGTSQPDEPHLQDLSDGGLPCKEAPRPERRPMSSAGLPLVWIGGSTRSSSSSSSSLPSSPAAGSSLFTMRFSCFLGFVCLPCSTLLRSALLQLAAAMLQAGTASSHVV